ASRRLKTIMSSIVTGVVTWSFAEGCGFCAKPTPANAASTSVKINFEKELLFNTDGQSLRVSVCWFTVSLEEHKIRRVSILFHHNLVRQNHHHFVTGGDHRADAHFLAVQDRRVRDDGADQRRGRGRHRRTEKSGHHNRRVRILRRRSLLGVRR